MFEFFDKFELFIFPDAHTFFLILENTYDKIDIMSASVAQLVRAHDC